MIGLFFWEGLSHYFSAGVLRVDLVLATLLSVLMLLPLVAVVGVFRSGRLVRRIFLAPPRPAERFQEQKKIPESGGLEETGSPLEIPFHLVLRQGARGTVYLGLIAMVFAWFG
jgi:hypothetical protein